MSTERSSQNTFLTLVAILVALVGIGFGGYGYGSYQAKAQIWEEAKTKGFAWHSRDTGVLQWKTSEELALTVMSNGDPLKLEKAIMVLRDPLPDGWNTSIDVTKLPQLGGDKIVDIPQPLVPDVTPALPRKR